MNGRGAGEVYTGRYRQRREDRGVLALLTTTMGVMKDVVDKAVEMGVRDKVAIMVAALRSPRTSDSIGADYYAPDAASAADVAYGILRA